MDLVDITKDMYVQPVPYTPSADLLALCEAIGERIVAAASSPSRIIPQKDVERVIREYLEQAEPIRNALAREASLIANPLYIIVNKAKVS